MADINGVNVDNLTVTDPSIARAVVAESQKHGVYKGSTPETDEAMVKVAGEMVNLARRALDMGAQGGAVVEVLTAAMQTGTPAQPAAPQEEANPFTQAAQQAPPAAPVAPAPPVAAPAAPTPPPAPVAPAPVAGTPAAAAPAPAQARTIEDIIPGYDDKSKNDILSALSQLSQADLDLVKSYEEQNEERSSILKFEHVPQASAPVDPAPPVATPPAQPTPEQANTTTLDPTATAQPDTDEPWPGFKGSKITDVMERIEQILASGDEATIKSTFAKVWAYESAAKAPRKRLLGKLQAIAENGMKSTGGEIAQVDPATAAQQAPVAAPAVPATPQQPDDADVKPQAAFPQAEAPAAPPVAAPTPAPQAPVPPATGEGVHSTHKAIETVNATNLPVPQDIPETELKIPYDFTQLSNDEVRTLQGKFNAAYAYAHVKVSEHEGFADDAKQHADNLVNQLIASGNATGKSVGETQAKALGLSPEAQEARRTQNDQAKIAKRFRALADVYYSTCERLSREQTGRQKDFETVK